MTSAFIDQMAYNLERYANMRGYTNLRDQYYIDMVLGGLMGASYFSNLDANTRARIKSLTEAEAINQPRQVNDSLVVNPQGTILCPL